MNVITGLPSLAIDCIALGGVLGFLSILMIKSQNFAGAFLCTSRQDRSATGSIRRVTRLNALSADWLLLTTAGFAATGFGGAFFCVGGVVVSTQAARKGSKAIEINFMIIKHHIVTVSENVIPSHIICEVGSGF